ncbi:MAG: glycoside hydrolase family 13 protein [Clostridiales Family XIII bacterium]|jgi:glycosidase|nr:glycoside hydrolase family 13 protein [Clostridiales Family XIII bacterium]
MNNISFGDIVISNVNIVHNSAMELYRSPGGAVPCGTEVHLRLSIHELMIERAVLCMLRGDGVDRLEMAREGDFYMARYIVPQDGGIVLWYWFEVVLQGGAVCYYGTEPPLHAGLGLIYRNPPPAFQLTVYDREFVTPAWAKRAVMYQVFPDRLRMGNPDRVRAGVEYHRSKGRGDVFLHESWDDTPVYEAKEGQKYYMPSDIFGGDLDGVRQRLAEMKELGVTVLYLNPIFEASSNHRYNTGDYRKIDPILGDEDAWRRLVGEAAALGIRIILDGVFSHTGDDSVYFNKYGNYEGLGAYQSQDSPYFKWYKFGLWPDRYTSWWGFPTLPEVNEGEPTWSDFVIEGEDSVLAHWIKGGASGWRLDVADELPDDTIEHMRAAVKRADPEAFLLGEVWEDATTKQSYNVPRRYALGRGLDSVMNYPFLNQTVAFLRGEVNAISYRKFLVAQRQGYPPEMLFALMNLLSSHDVIRVRTALSRPADAKEPHDMTRAEQAAFSLTAEQYAHGGKLQRLAAALQFSVPGIPAVYYGDEVGMTGLLDPFNRRPWHEEDASIRGWYKRLAALRGSHPVLQAGHVLYYSTNGNVIGVLRYTHDGKDAFGGEMEPDVVLTVVNPTAEAHRIVIDLTQEKECQPREHREAFLSTRWKQARSLTEEGHAFSLEAGLFEIEIGPLSAEMFQLTKEEGADERV